MRPLLSLLIFALCFPALTTAQTLRGVITDLDTGTPLAGATVYLPAVAEGTITDSLGRYRITELTPGRYRVEVTYIGYESLEVPEILITSGKERVLDIALREASTELAAVVIRAPRLRAGNGSPTLQVLTQEETLRFPATFLDPARLATAYAGVVATNDQANHLSIRGQTPNGTQWRLEGLEIVNPNHTANAGTFTDRSTVSGGGVNAMSAQLLDNTLFYRGGFPTTYGNTTAAVIDMRLRTGNNEQREYTVQAGLIGFDVSTEGPFRKGGASYLVNYRYSFTGLLSDLGVPLGDEDIRFQDLSFHLTFPRVLGGRLSLFGLFGKSSNEFTGPEDPAEIEEEKDLYEYINYDSRQATAGFRWTRPAGRRGLWRVTGAWSGLDSKREDLATDRAILPRKLDRIRQTKASLITAIRLKTSSSTSWEAGAEAVAQINRHLWPTAQDFDDVPRERTGVVVQPFVQWSGRYEALSWEVGMRAAYYPQWLDEAIYPEPRLLLAWQAGRQSRLSFSYGLYSEAPGIYNGSLLPQRAQQLNLGWSQHLNPSLQLTAQAYYHDIFQAYGDQFGRSVLNGLEEDFLINFVGSDPENLITQGRNVGVELSLQQFAGEGWWYLLSGTVYDSRYRYEEGEWWDTRFNGRYAASLTLGRELTGTDRQGRARTLGFNLAARFNGGLRQAPILVEQSRLFSTTIFDYTDGFTEQLPDYFRVDLRIYYTKNFENSSSTLSLDIQNVSGQQNTAYLYYDRFLDAVTTRYQLEFIPILSYRLSFRDRTK